MAKPSDLETTAAKPGEKLSRMRQRQKLIDACISALHLHGPSRTTIDKVVAIADMSPGIVNFYFETKAALLIAALETLAVEFEEKVLLPLAALRETPVIALRRLVELYLDPDIASPRKVSVWYAFWGEASSRHEYYDICGKRDLAFAELVRELMARLIDQSGARHLDPDAVALGLIGSLEMIWQGIAFQDESDIDRLAARQRCFAYLSSIFPAQFPSKASHASASNISLPAPQPTPSSDPTPDGCAKLLAGELSLAGLRAMQMPANWPGYSLLVQLEIGQPHRIAVVPVVHAHGAGVVDLAESTSNADWLGFVIPASDCQRHHRFFLVPCARIISAIVLTSEIETQFARYENNFRLLNDDE
jgi:TetR/AcrR family transcriptional repressor of bet genes